MERPLSRDTKTTFDSSATESNAHPNTSEGQGSSAPDLRPHEMLRETLKRNISVIHWTCPQTHFDIIIASHSALLNDPKLVVLRHTSVRWQPEGYETLSLQFPAIISDSGAQKLCRPLTAVTNTPYYPLYALFNDTTKRTHSIALRRRRSL